MFDFSSSASIGDWSVQVGSGGGYGYPTGYPYPVTGAGYPASYPTTYTATMSPQTQQLLFLGLIIVAVVILTKR